MLGQRGIAGLLLRETPGSEAPVAIEQILRDTEHGDLVARLATRAVPGGTQPALNALPD